ncbi:MAG: hypothetical protein L6Q97_03885 [Thermoanaerobaculia bacterium]|nr:hypothetical protein [Thermoanaerobaculia bacterium]
MHSYTFNSESGQFERALPKQPWGRIALIVLLVVTAATAAWEMYWRSRGYETSYDGTDSSWAEFRAQAQHAGPEYTIIAGSSRALFDIDLPTWRAESGNKPVIQLAKEGSAPLPIVRDLIEHTDFAGTLVVSVAPGLFFFKNSMHDDDAGRLVKHYHNWSPAQKMEHWANLLMEPTFAFVEKGELNLGNLLQEMELPNRPDYLAGYDRVPKLSNDTRERQARMWSRVVTDTAYAQRVQGIWMGFSARTGPLMRPADYASKKAVALAGKFQPLPPPLQVSPAERDSFFMEIKSWADKLRARGGKMIFIRPPSTGMLYQLEEQNFPRKDTWDALLEKTGVPGIHFEDHPELQGFELPEWSHLRAEHAPPFTKALVKLVTRAE